LKKKILCAMLLATMTIPLFYTVCITPSWAQAKAAPPWDWKYEQYGPRSDAIVYKIILSYESRLVAFEADEIDTTGVRPEHVDRIKKNRPDAFFLESMGRVIDALQFNTRPKKEPSGADNYPMNILDFRKALAHMIDRDYFVFEAHHGYGVPAFTPMPGLYGDWISPKAKTYEYNMDKARKLLDDAGFKLGPDGRRIDPRTNTSLRELEVLVLPETTSPARFMMAKHISSQATKLGLKINIRTVDSPTLDKLVTETHEHDMYMWGWSLGMYPTFLHDFFISTEDTLGGWNECGVRDAELDDILNKFYFAPTVDEAKPHCHKALEIIQDRILPWVGTSVPVAITAVSGKLKGMVLQKVPGIDTPLGRNWLDDLNLHVVNAPFGYTLRFPIGIQVGTLSPMIYLWADEGTIISDMYETNTISSPEDVYKRVPRLAEKVLIETFDIKPNVKGTKITITIKKGLTWHDGEPLTAKDYNFTVWYPGKEWKTRRFYGEFEKKIYKTEIPDPQTFIAYLEGTSFTYQRDSEGYRPLPAHIYSKLKDPKKDDPAKLPHSTLKGFTMLVGEGPYALKEFVPGTHVVITWNPSYYMRHPEKGLTVTFTQIPTTVFADDVPIQVELKITDYLNRPVTNATVSATADGKVYTATHVKDGVYRFTLSELPMTGALSVNVKAQQALPLGSISKAISATMTVYLAKWLIAAIVVVVVALIAAALWFRKKRGAAREAPK